MKYLFNLLVLACLFSCQTSSTSETIVKNPPAEGFDLLGSDPMAIAIADSVMIASGGREAWDETEFLQWNFFGSRRHQWNKKTGDLVITGIKDTFEIYINLKTKQGTVSLDGKTHTNPDTIEKYLQLAEEMWINDSYWLFLPYKLKDDGVTLKYLGQDTMSNGQLSEVLALTFKNVGVTPNNKYHIHVDPTTYLIKQWDFYKNASDEKVRFSTPWNSYKNYDQLVLASDRGENYEITDISAGEQARFVVQSQR